MTLDQAIKRIQDKQSQIRQLELEIADTKNSLINLTELRKGQKVKVSCRGKETVCFIGGVEYLGYGKCGYRYTFNAVKKNGTMSQHGASVYSYDTVQLAD